MNESHSTEASPPPHDARRTLLFVYVGLIVLLVLTAIGAYLPTGRMVHEVLAFSISIAKTVLIVWFFMEFREEKMVTRLFAGAGLVWLLILFLLTFPDYATR